MKHVKGTRKSRPRGDDYDDFDDNDVMRDMPVGSIMQLNDEPFDVDPEKQPIGFRFSENK